MKGFQGGFKTAFVCLTTSLAVLSCKQSDGAKASASAVSAASLAPFSVRLNWAPAIESAVNSPGGGYLVLMAIDQDADVNTPTTFRVPYVSGLLAPTSLVVPNLTLRDGHYYTFRIQSYSALNTGSALSLPYIVRANR